VRIRHCLHVQVLRRQTFWFLAFRFFDTFPKRSAVAHTLQSRSRGDGRSTGHPVLSGLVPLPAQPITAFLQQPLAQLLRHKPVVTMIAHATWLMARKKAMLERVGARLLANVVLSIPAQPWPAVDAPLDASGSGTSSSLPAAGVDVPPSRDAVFGLALCEA
jgi:hypothetical protein